MIALIAFIVAAGLVSGCGEGGGCPDQSDGGLCRELRIPGLDPHGELGFRFGEPLDLDGDGAADLVAGSRRAGAGETGEVMAWNARGDLLGIVRGDAVDGLFGNVAVAMPDLDGDQRADLVISAPHARDAGAFDGLVEAYRLDGQLIWRAAGRAVDGFGWHLARAGDHDGDGIEDLWVGAPSSSDARVYLLSGATGEVVQTIRSPRPDDQFGWYLVGIDDLDGDGTADVAIGAPAATISGARRGAVLLVSGATGAPIRELVGDRAGTDFGVVMAPVDDLDDDGVGEIAVGAPSDGDAATPGRGEVQFFSGATGTRLRTLSGGHDTELYGRMVARVDDLDADGLRDLAIGAPWWRGRDGRFELRSARNFALLADVRGSEAGWLGWHLARADGGVLASQLHLDADRGALELYRVR